MAVKTKQRNRLDWYIVLTTFVLLISFSTSPRAMNFEEFVAGSSSSLHALVKTPVMRTFPSRAEKWKTARENIVASKIYKNWINIQKYTRPHLRKDVEAGFVRNTFREYSGPMILRIISLGKFVPEFKAAAKLLGENIMLCSDEKVLAIIRIGKKVPSFQAGARDLEKSIVLYESDERVLGMIASGKHDPELKATAENLKSSLMIKWLMAGRNEEVFASLREGQGEWIQFLQCPLWSALINDKRYNKELVYLTVSEMLEQHVKGQELDRLIIDAKRIDDTRELATGLEKWSKAGYSGYDAFKLLGLDRTNAMNDPLWKWWVSYLRKRAGKEDPGGTPKEDAVLVALALQGHMTDNDVKKLAATGETNEQTSQFANRLGREFEPWLKLGN